MLENDADTKALGHEDIMALLREARESGFAQQASITTDKGQPFQSADIWQSFDHLSGDVASAPKSEPEMSPDTSADIDLAQLVQERIKADAPAIEPEPVLETPRETLIDVAPQEDIIIPELEAIKEQSYSEGFGEGLTMGKSQGYEEGYNAAMAEVAAQQDDQLAPMIDIFETLSQQLLATSEAQAQAISAQIQSAVFALASDRAGTEIDALPKPFISRIEKIAERVIESVDTAIIRVNPQDLEAITPHLKGSEIALTGRFVEDPHLSRGDITIKAGSIKLDDILKPRRKPS